MTNPTQSSVTLGLVQHQCAVEPDVNMRKAVQGVRHAAARGAQIVCLQELFRFQYFCEGRTPFFDLAEPSPAVHGVLSALAAELGVVIVASLFEKRAEGLYHNTAAIIDADAISPVTREHAHSSRPAVLREVYLTPGDLGFRSWESAVRPDRCAGPSRPAHRSGRTACPSCGSRGRRA